MSFKNHETFIRETTVRADKFLKEFWMLIPSDVKNGEIEKVLPNIAKFLEEFSNITVFAEYQKEWLDTFIREFYYQVNVKTGQHNSVMPLKSTWQKCPNCNKRVFTILNPNDFVMGSRTADYRIFCLDCQWTYLIKNTVHNERQSIYSFLKKGREYFKLTI